MGEFLTIRQFAALAGTTVKALRHYGRLGLLVPKRSPSGYRRYTAADLERLEQIAALKLVGFSLRRARELLGSGPVAIREALQQQKRTLTAQRDSISAAIAAIEAAESGAPILRNLGEVIEMHEAIGEMRCYYKQDAAWTKAIRFWIAWPSEERRQLYRDAWAGAPDPVRWLELEARECGGDAELRWGAILAWRNREYWPSELRERARDFDLERVHAALRAAALELLRERLRPADVAARAGLDSALFVEIVEALGADPAGDRAASLAAQWWEAMPGGLGQTLIARWRELVAAPADLDTLLTLFGHRTSLGDGGSGELSVLGERSIARRAQCRSGRESLDWSIDLGVDSRQYDQRLEQFDEELLRRNPVTPRVALNAQNTALNGKADGRIGCIGKDAQLFDDPGEVCGIQARTQGFVFGLDAPGRSTAERPEFVHVRKLPVRGALQS
ncbi:MAG: MerR family transcriptional regulator [Bryobacteraceae bacterium]